MSKGFMSGAIILALSVLVGCTPGEAEFTLKTSELRKALHGKVAHIRVHETMTTVLSNATGKVSFGNGRFTNQLDVVKALAAKIGKNDPFDFTKGTWTNDAVRIWVEENTNALPCVKLDAQLNIALGTKDALMEQAKADLIDDLCVLEIDPETGRICEIGDMGKGSPFPNQRAVIVWSAAVARGELLEALFGQHNEELVAVDGALISVLLPTWFKNLSCVIVGDDEPLYVIADDAKVNGKLMSHFEGWVRKGENLHLTLDKAKHGRDGGVRFLLNEPERECKISRSSRQ